MPNRPLVAPQVQAISFDPAAAMQDVASIQINRQKLEAAREASMARMRMQQLQSQYPDDPDAMITALSREFPAAGYELGKSYGDYRKSQYDSLTAKATSEAKSLETSINMLMATGGPENLEHYGMLRDLAVQRDPQLGQILPPKEQLTPERWEAVLSATQQGLAFSKQKRDSLQMFQNGEYQPGLGKLLAVAPNEAVARKTLDGALMDPRAKPFVETYRAMLDAAPDFATFKQQAASATISPEKQADDARAAEAAAETARHNKVSEGISGAHLQLSRATEARLAKAAKEGKGPEGIKLSAEAQKDLTTMLTVKDINNEILTLGDKVGWKGVGAFGAGSASQLGAKLGYGTEDEIGLRTKIGNVRGTIAVLRGGTSFTEGEKALLDTYTPDINDSAREIRVKIRGLNDLVETKRRNLLRVASGEWTGTGTSAAPPGDVEVWERGPDGKPRKVKR